MFAPEGTFDGFRPGVFPALHDWFRAEGWTFGGGGCGIHGWGLRRGVVGCGFTYENDLTRALGICRRRDYALSFVIDAGRIETAWFGAGGNVSQHVRIAGPGTRGSLRPRLGHVHRVALEPATPRTSPACTTRTTATPSAATRSWTPHPSSSGSATPRVVASPLGAGDGSFHPRRRVGRRRHPPGG